MKLNKLFFKVFAGVLWEWVVIPVLFFIFLPDGKRFQFLFPSNNFLRYTIGILFFIPSFFLTLFSCLHLHRKGKGTIMPQNPPKKLVNDGVYKYCRNPMYLGYSFLFASFSFFLKNLSFLFISIGVIVFIFFYSKFYEEKVLYKRFGEEYLEYKRKTSFIIPFKRKIFGKNFFSFLFIYSDVLFLFLLFYVLKVTFTIIYSI